MINIKTNLEILRNQIAEAEKLYHRKPGSVKLLAVSKARSIEEIKIAVAAGQMCFGENYLQEALPKINVLKQIEWHFIGTVQSNKTKLIAENFSWVHSIAEYKIAQRLNDQRPPDLPPLNICIQINVSDEPSKSGISFAELPDLAQAIKQLPNLNFRGLMAIPKFTDDFDKQRENFRKMAEAFRNLQNQGFAIDTLSIGMSGDFKAAIAEGATIIRIGTAVFGER